MKEGTKRFLKDVVVDGLTDGNIGLGGIQIARGIHDGNLGEVALGIAGITAGIVGKSKINTSYEPRYFEDEDIIIDDENNPYK